jgi:hypothetical protein
VPNQPCDSAHQFRRALFLIVRLAADHAVAGMIVQQSQRYFIQSGLRRTDLSENIDAVSVFFDHAGHTPHLTLDALQAIEHRFFVNGITASLGHFEYLSLMMAIMSVDDRMAAPASDQISIDRKGRDISNS